MQTYLFYDIETTGLNKSFDQILQFAAIRTDLHFKEIKRYELNIKLNPDIIPSPGAIITHHIGMQISQDQILEIDAIQQIHQILNEPGTISLGYNTLGFDDEFLRFSFYRNLLPPYTHQYANQCSRMDIYPMTIMYYLFKNSVLTWPEKDGKISLKLEDLNKANQLASGRAHNAMVDVEATLALTQRLLKDRSMWDYIAGYFNKQIDQTRSQQEESLLVHGKLGRESFFQAPVLFLGNSLPYKHQIWLRLDSKNLANPNEETLQDYKLVVKKKIGEPAFILPLQDRFLTHLSAERKERAESHKQWLFEHRDFLDHLADYHIRYYYPDFPETDIDSRLYLDGFWTREEENFCRRFHQVSPIEKAALTEKIQNPKLKSLATRLLGRYYPDVMTQDQADYFIDYMKKIHPINAESALIDFQGNPRLTPTKAQLGIDTLRKDRELSKEQASLLDELSQYLEKKFLNLTPNL